MPFKKVLFTLLLTFLFSITHFLNLYEYSGTVEATAEKMPAAVVRLLPGDDIQKALDELPDGGKIILGAGTYDTLEAIVLTERKQLTLEGEGEVWINTKGIDHHVITLMDCRGVTLHNIKAQHVILEKEDNAPVSNPADGAVVGIIGGANNRVTGCELVGCGIYGVYAKATTPLLIESSYLHHNSKSAVFLEAGAGMMEAVIRDCTITMNAGSIEVQGDVVVTREGKNRLEHNRPEDYHRN